MQLSNLAAVFDGIFVAVAVFCLAVVRVAPVMGFDRLSRELDRLLAARAETDRGRASLKGLANVARLMEVVPRAATAVDEDRPPAVTAVLRGRRARFDLLSNFFVKSAVIQGRIDRHLADLRTACLERRREAAAGYMSPFNPLNLPSSVARYLGLDLPPRAAMVLDGIAWLIAGAMAATVALRV